MMVDVSIERRIVVEIEQGEGAGDAQVEEMDSEKIVEEIVDGWLPHTETLSEGDAHPDDRRSQPIDVAL